MPLVPRLTVYCNPADSFLQPHFYEFSISPLYRVSRPFIKQYVAAMFAYFPEFVTAELEPQSPACKEPADVGVSGGQSSPGQQLGQVTPGYSWVGKVQASVLL